MIGGVTLAPIAFSLQVMLSYTLAADTAQGVPPQAGIAAVNLAALAAIANGLAISIGNFRATRDEKEGGHREVQASGEGRTRFLAYCGLCASAIFGLAVIVQLTAITHAFIDVLASPRSTDGGRACLSRAQHTGMAARTHGGWSIEPVALGLLIAIDPALCGRVRAHDCSAASRDRATAASACLCRRGRDDRRRAILTDRCFCRRKLCLAHGPAPAADARRSAAHGVCNTHLVALFAFPISPRRRIGRAVNGAPGVRQGADEPLRAAARRARLRRGAVAVARPANVRGRARQPGTAHGRASYVPRYLGGVLADDLDRGQPAARRVERGRAGDLVALQGNLLAALIALAPHPLYEAYAANALSDQQVAGLLMWLPAGLLYLASSVRSIMRLQAVGKA